MVPRPVPDAPTESTAGQDPVLDAVIAEYLTAIQAGQRPDRGEILRRHPELVRPLEEFFADYD